MKTFIQHEMSCCAEVLNFLKDLFLLNSVFSWTLMSKPRRTYAKVHYCDIYFRVFDFEMHSQPVGLLWLKAVVMSPDIYPCSSDLVPCFLLRALNLNPTPSLLVPPLSSHWTQEAWCLLLFFDLFGAGGSIKHSLISLPISLHWTKSKHAKRPVSCSHFLSLAGDIKPHVLHTDT